MANCNSLTGGVSKTCDKNKGGIRKMWLTEHANITALALGSPVDFIATITMAGATQFWEFEFNKGSSNFVEEVTGDAAAGTQVNTQTITLFLSRREKAKRDRLEQVSGFKELAAIVLDNNGIYWLLGEENGVVMQTNNAPTGQAAADANGYTLTFVGEESELANTVDPAAVAAVI